MSLTKVTYSMISGSIVNVCDFGADPTGVTNSTSAIQAAITSLNAGDTLLIPAGTYIGYDININKSQILVENYGNFTLPANARASIFKFTEGVSDVVFVNYGILNHNKANQGNLNTITTGTAVFEVSNSAATNLTYRVQIQNYGTIKNGANSGIYYHTRVADLVINPVGYITGCRNDGIAGSALNYRVRIANGILISNGAYGSNINADSDYIEINNVQIKGTTLQDDGVTPGLSNGISIGHSGTPPETALRCIISNCHIYDIDNSTVGILVKSGLSDQSIIANSSIHRTNGDTSGGVAIRIVGGVANGEGLVISGNSITGPWGVGVSSWDFSSTGFVTNNVVISGNFIDTSAFASSVGVQLYSGSDYTISGNRIKADLYGIETQLPYVSITGNRIVSASVGVKVKDGSDYLVCSTNNIFASTDANAVVLDAYDDGRSIGLNRKQTLLQSGIPIQPLVVGSGATNPAIASKENGGTSSFTCALNNQVSGKTSFTFNGGMYFVSNLTDGTHAIFVWTSSTASGGFAILSSQGANWSTTYNDAAKEGIAFNASTDGPFIFSNRGSSKNYQIVCFGGA